MTSDPVGFWDLLFSALDVLEVWQTLVAGLVGFGGLAWVTSRNADHERRRSERADKALVIALSIELAHLTREIGTARRLLEEGGPQIVLGRDRLTKVHKSAFFDLSLERTGTLPEEFLTAVIGFLFAKRDVCERYGKAANLDVDRAIAALEDVEARYPSILVAASKQYPDYNFDRLQQ